MAELELRMADHSRLRTVAASAPRAIMGWEDWLTLVPAILTFGAVAVAVQQADLVNGMPPLPLTTMGGLMVGLLMARNRMAAPIAHLVGFALGMMVVLLVVQDYAEGGTVAARLADVRLRLWEWWSVVRSGDISNDNLPFVLVVHGIAMMAAYIAAWSIFRWRNAWFAVLPSGIGILATIAAIDGRPSAAFIVFMLGALLLIARLNLQRRQVQWREHDIPYPEFISLSALQLSTALAVSLVVAAWLIPLGKQADVVDATVDRITSPVTSQSETFTRLFHSVNTSRGGNFHKFGSTMPIRGDVALGNKTLASVDPSEDGVQFIRAASYNEYTGTGWKASERQIQELGANELPTQGVEGTQFVARKPVSLTVTVVDAERTLFSFGTPLGSNIAAEATLPKGFAGDIERLTSHSDLVTGDVYVVGGTVSVATPEQLYAAGTDYPAWVADDRYLQLPDSLPQRVIDLANEVVGDAQTPFEKALAIEAYLRQFPFDYAVPAAPPGRDSTDYFLFDLQRGYFDYFSTAMVVMLRAVDVPARLAVGYALDPEDEERNGSTVVRKNDAYSWAEVYFNQYGWVDFNPSPDLPAGGFNAAPGVSVAPPVGIEEAPDLGSLFDELEDLIGPEAPVGGAGSLDANDGFRVPWLLIWIVAGLVAVLAAAGGSATFAWNWQFRGLSGVPRLWAKTQRLGGWTDLKTGEEETAREWAERLAESTEMPNESKVLADAYQETRYGRPDLVRSDPEETESAYLSVRGALVSKIFRRKQRLPDERAAADPEE